MKILVIGAGVIGTAYAWVIHEAGYDVTLYVRPHKLEAMREVHISCLDKRRKKPVQINTIYRPKVTDQFTSADGYDLILVCVKYNQLESVLPMLSEAAGEADILFFQNMWEIRKKIEPYLRASQYFLGFPSVGGGKTENRLDCFLESSFAVPNLLGEVNGEITPRVKAAAAIFKQAGFKPVVSKYMTTWLTTHYVWAASFLGGVVKAGSVEEFSRNPVFIKETYLAMREGFRVCRQKGFEVKKVAPQSLYDTLPLFLLTMVTRKMFQQEEMQNMLKAHIAHSPDEMLGMYYDVLNDGQAKNIEIPYYIGFKDHIDKYFTQ
ncbi:hypothetical protein LQV63_11730 [Paenibacillus profundus]|uniref:Ketopantoate reductase N-terminal domain-containing protein n=1 Tax=Paenibacillus profundus TaxID=1173085 RepID=A0ABS8YFH9_9BACL|nr:2-dehydropantoate 2-reductase N-terminal domain-containing protein [Paenibacillus profundus]MCE5169979.1 hypothetical protein [Paenibacillus profundus]